MVVRQARVGTLMVGVRHVIEKATAVVMGSGAVIAQQSWGNVGGGIRMCTW